ncbi:MAG: flagellar basal body L-ring protein FlgH [Rickettsiales bacterium]|nr:flagellar basal body L-ring protein FlgH [Pseudomonadota bacterium]MDA0965493.1 flagellar basal body L-ring protein FlgH [Pseudomonadota bacterium]MDG4542817.1 flagellar basal body L-ring protein FlgH [Rickettsiales bacterium]MDG4544735.1 flagellar basal body L-ring protein FlgH [Rickettsiales bacterium]MDG4546857.1 flagellar basal body L-ring protein FlgH [Rickettsiales bacterium]
MQINNLSKAISILLVTTVVSGCGDSLSEMKNIGKEPPLEKMELPMSKRSYEPVEWEEEESELQPQYANSLWQQGARAFFKDMKARRVGDILKVVVKIQDKAELENSTQRSRSTDEDSNAGSVFGIQDKLLDVIPGTSPASFLLDVASTGTSSGTGTVDREEIIETEIASMVTQILPNGNLVIHGDQEIRVNFEVRKITVDGIVRQEDIAADNSIDSNQIAEARISYGGRGQLTNVQQPRYGTQILDLLTPF